jgi:hypothetical protein
VNTATKITELPALTADLLQSNSCLVDNLFADLWKQMGLVGGTSNIIPFRRHFFFLIQLVVVLI